MIAWLVSAALGAPVICDPLQAATVLSDARIAEARAPFSHPELVPGLALGSARTDEALRVALTELCTGDARLSLAPGDRWDTPSWSAHTFVLTASEHRGCVLYQRSIALSVGIEVGVAPRYVLRNRLPVAQTPVGDCPNAAVWREETVLDGEGGPVRVVLVRDRSDEQELHSEVVVRRATQGGWTEQTLLEPAPSRLTGGQDGPVVELAARQGARWVVAHGDRVHDDGVCRAVAGQTVWIPDGSAWAAVSGRSALARLASRGLWRFAGEDGWVLIVAQAEEDERDVLDVRVRRVQRTFPEAPITVVESAWFPGLNPGFVVAVPTPWATEAEAREARRTVWRRRRRAYVKRAWTAADPCAGE